MRRSLVLISAIVVAAAVTLPGQTRSALVTADITVSGQVITAADRQPLANARIVPPPASPDRPFVFSGENGRFTITAAPGSPLTISKAGYMPRTVNANRGSALEIALDRNATLTGRVIVSDGQPMTGVRVMLAAPPGGTAARAPAGAPPLPPNVLMTAATDDRGEFRFAPAPLSPVVLVVMAPVRELAQIQGSVGYVDRGTLVSYFPGVSDPGSAEVFQVRPGDERGGLDFLLDLSLATPVPSPVMPRLGTGTGSISGRAFNAEGQPLDGVQVSVNGPETAGRTATTLTDGSFAFHDLPAGPLRLVGEKRGYFNSLATMNLGLGGADNVRAIELTAGERRDGLALKLQRIGSLSGRVVDEHGEPLRGVQVQALQLRYAAGLRRLIPFGSPRVTDDLGAYRIFNLVPGSYILSAAPGGGGSMGISGYGRSFYPDAPDAAQAPWVTLGTNDDVIGLDIVMARARGFTVSGQMFDATGQPTGSGRLELMSSRRANVVANNPVGARILPDGRFEFTDVTPGSYIIQAGNGRANAWTEYPFVAVPVSVGNGDVSGIVVKLMSGSDVSGRLVFDAPAATPGPRLGGLEITTVPLDTDLAPNSLANARLANDGTFEMHGLNGPRRLVVRRLPEGWALKEIRVRGMDVTDAGIAFGRPDQSIADLEVVLTNRVTTIAGNIVDNRMAPLEGVRVAVFPFDRAQWIPGSRFLTITTSARDGRFTVAGLPPETYHVAPVIENLRFGPDSWQDPEFLESLIGRATTVTLNDGQQINTTLRVSR